MARLHTHRKGRAGSRRPMRDAAPSWQPLDPKGVEEQVVTLAKEGKPPSVIGAYLRDQFGVPDVKLATGTSVLAILKANDLSPKLPEDLAQLLERVVNLQEHLKDHKKDLSNRRQLGLTDAKIRRLARYYKRTDVLPADWAYSLGTARLLLE